MPGRRIENLPLGVTEARPRRLQNRGDLVFQTKMPVMVDATGERRIFDPLSGMLVDLGCANQRNGDEQNGAAEKRKMCRERKT
jgi:hypothetical protein